MAAEAGAGIKRHEAEGLGRGAVDDFPDVEIHAQAELLQLVHQRDVHAAEDVFEQLDHFGGARGADGNDVSRRSARRGPRRASAGRIDAANDFGNLREAELFVAGIFALRREGQDRNRWRYFRLRPVRDRAAQAALFENRQDQFFGGARIGGAFEHDQLIALQVRRDGVRGLLDVAQVRLAALIERRGDADQDRVHVAQAGEIGCGVEALRVDVRSDFFGGNVLDVGSGRR